jgi:hypothetical protein
MISFVSLLVGIVRSRMATTSPVFSHRFICVFFMHLMNYVINNFALRTTVKFSPHIPQYAGYKPRQILKINQCLGKDFSCHLRGGGCLLEALSREGSRWQVGFDDAVWWPGEADSYPISACTTYVFKKRPTIRIQPEDCNWNVCRNAG